MNFQSLIIVEDITNSDDINHIFNFLSESKIVDSSFAPKTSLVEVVKKSEEKISIGIKELGVKLDFLSKKVSDEQIKILIINDAHLLTEEAQNSILKILEEPYDRSLIILRCQNINYLLGTVTSRCRVEYFTRKPDYENLKVEEKILNMNFFERSKYFEEISEKFSRYEIKLILENVFEKIILLRKDNAKEVLSSSNFKDEIANLLISIDSSINMKIIFNNINVKIKKIIGT